MRLPTAMLAVLVIVAAACQLTAAGVVSGAVGMFVAECPSSVSNCTPRRCTEDGKCIFDNPLCLAKCKCQCSPYAHYDASESTCSSGSGCHVRGCLQDGTCVMNSWACKEACECGCAITKQAESTSSCPGQLGCSVIGCTPDNKCLFNRPKCKSQCSSCSCRPKLQPEH